MMIDTKLFGIFIDFTSKIVKNIVDPLTYSNNFVQTFPMSRTRIYHLFKNEYLRQRKRG